MVIIKLMEGKKMLVKVEARDPRTLKGYEEIKNFFKSLNVDLDRYLDGSYSQESLYVWIRDSKIVNNNSIVIPRAMFENTSIQGQYCESDGNTPLKVKIGIGYEKVIIGK